MTDTEKMTHWIRTYWRDDIEEVTEINDRLVFPSLAHALNAGISQLFGMEVPQRFVVLQECDIMDLTNVVHIQWYTGGDRHDVLDGDGKILHSIHVNEQKVDES